MKAKTVEDRLLELGMEEEIIREQMEGAGLRFGLTLIERLKEVAYERDAILMTIQAAQVVPVRESRKAPHSQRQVPSGISFHLGITLAVILILPVLILLIGVLFH